MDDEKSIAEKIVDLIKDTTATVTDAARSAAKQGADTPIAVGHRTFGLPDRVVLIESNGHANSSPTLYSALGVILSWRDDTI